MLTKSEWEIIENRLSSPYGRIVLKADGHELTLIVQRIKLLKYAIAVYIDGWIEGKNLSLDSDLGNKFYRRCSKFLHGKKFRDDMKKLKRFIGTIDKKYEWLLPYFPNANSLKKQLLKTCSELTVLES